MSERYSGKNFARESSRLTSPFSTNWSTATAVNCLETEAILNEVFASILVPVAMSARP